jgi:hypothetical protein
LCIPSTHSLTIHGMNLFICRHTFINIYGMHHHIIIIERRERESDNNSCNNIFSPATTEENECKIYDSFEGENVCAE